MPHFYGHGSDGLVLEAWWGDIGKEELLRHERSHLLAAKPSRAPRVVVDLTLARFDSSVGEREIRELTNLYVQYQATVGGARVAIVLGSELDKVYLYEKYATERGLSVVVFNSIEVACVWLGANAAQVREWVREAPLKVVDQVAKVDVEDGDSPHGIDL